MTTFSWPPPPPASTSGGTSAGLETSGDPVDVSGAAPPVAGQVLTASDATHAEWRVPGLKYDGAIRFNIDALGSATIEPGTWGFVQTVPVASTGVTVFIVSSLAAPPVDSRFGLYVSPSVAVPVTVSLVGASQIMGLDGVLATSITLLPGAMYEWVFYHEAGAAIWGLVSDTAHRATRLYETSGPTTLDIAGIAAGQYLVRVGTSIVGVSPTAPISHASSHGRGGTDIVAASRISESAGPTVLDVGAIAATQYLARNAGSSIVGVSSATPSTHASSHARGGADIVTASKISESSGPTALDVAAVSDGQYLKRSGTTIVGATAASIETRVLATEVFTNSTSITALAHTIAANESVLIEWGLQGINATGSVATTDGWNLEIADGTAKSVSRQAFHGHIQIAGGATVKTQEFQQVGGTMNSVQQIMSFSFGATPTTNFLSASMFITNGGTAFTVRISVATGSNPMRVYAGSWSRITRGATVA